MMRNFGAQILNTANEHVRLGARAEPEGGRKGRLALEHEQSAMLNTPHPFGRRRGRARGRNHNSSCPNRIALQADR